MEDLGLKDKQKFEQAPAGGGCGCGGCGCGGGGKATQDATDQSQQEGAEKDQ